MTKDYFTGHIGKYNDVVIDIADSSVRINVKATPKHGRWGGRNALKVIRYNYVATIDGVEFSGSSKEGPGDLITLRPSKK